MIGKSAEIKIIVSKNDFIHLYEKLLKLDRELLDMELKEQIVYFADTIGLDYYLKKQLAVRYRRNNKGLEVVVKKRGVTKVEYEKLFDRYGSCENHVFKVDIDQVSPHHKTISCALKHNWIGVHQSFAFYQKPSELLTGPQKKFIKQYKRKNIDTLHFLIPIQSKTFSFPCAYKEFDIISLEERRMPHLFGKRLYEITVKTMSYSQKTTAHFIAFLESFGLTINYNAMYKTQRLYEAYFGL